MDGKIMHLGKWKLCQSVGIGRDYRWVSVNAISKWSVVHEGEYLSVGFLEEVLW